MGTSRKRSKTRSDKRTTPKLAYSRGKSGSTEGTPTLAEERAGVFRVTKGGKKKEYQVSGGFGYFVVSFKKASSIHQIGELVESGITSKDIEPLVSFLDLKVPEIAKAAAVSASTVLRWEPNTSIGVAGTNQFFKIDEVVKKGIDLFGGEQELRAWLNSPNMALGNQTPAKLLTSQIGVQLVDEALDALHFGNVM